MDKSIQGIFVNEGYAVKVAIKDKHYVDVTTLHNDREITSTSVTHAQAAERVDILIREGYVRYG
jgi:hypothetical protein